MSIWTGMSAGSLKSMIRTIDNKIAYRSKQIEENQALIRDWERQREEMAAALAEVEADDGGPADG